MYGEDGSLPYSKNNKKNAGVVSGQKNGDNNYAMASDYDVSSQKKGDNSYARADDHALEGKKG